VKSVSSFTLHQKIEFSINRSTDGIPSSSLDFLFTKYFAVEWSVKKLKWSLSSFSPPIPVTWTKREQLWKSCLLALRYALPFIRAWSPSFVDYVPRAAITYDQAGRTLAKERKLEVGALVVSLTSCSWLCLLDSWLFWNPSLNPRSSCLFPKPPLFVGELWPWNSISIWRRMNR